MENDAYIEVLKEWERRVADPAVYEHLDVLFPSYAFRRLSAGSERDHWASRFKLDRTLPRTRNAEKTVVYRSDMRFREQGEWVSGVGVIDKIMSDEGLSSVYEAYQYVSSRLGLDMPRPDSREVGEAISRSQRRAAILDTLVDYFCWNFRNNKSARAVALKRYLKTVRGFSEAQCSMLRLGFVPDWSRVIRYITVDKKYRLEELDEVCGVRNADGYTAVGKTHVLAIPYVCAGEVKGFLFRRIDDSKDGPKYIANTGLDRRSVFFNMPAAPADGRIVVVEGELDALKATAEGMQGVVAIGGSEISGDRRHQVEDAFRRGVKHVTLCLDLDPDRDNPGQGNAAARHEHVMKSVHTIKDVDIDFEEISVALFSEPTDPDEYIRGRGVQAFKALLEDTKTTPSYWEYLYGYKVGTGPEGVER